MDTRRLRLSGAEFPKQIRYDSILLRQFSFVIPVERRDCFAVVNTHLNQTAVKIETSGFVLVLG
jgi:hypothetical protein